MKIEKNTVVTLDYRMTDAQGNALEEGQDPIVYLHGDYDEIFPRLEKLLDGKKVGDQVSVQLEPDDAFGDYDGYLLRVESRSLFPEPLEIGMQFEGIPEAEDDEVDEDGESIIFIVTDIAEDKVVLDGNHPMAGIAIRMECTVTDIRLATAEELDHQHAFTDDGEDDEELPTTEVKPTYH